jgi:hypothetical protein
MGLMGLASWASYSYTLTPANGESTPRPDHRKDKPPGGAGHALLGDQLSSTGCETRAI